MAPLKRKKEVLMIGATVAISNMLFLLYYYFVLIPHQGQSLPRSAFLLAMVAVFPLDFFFGYFSEEWYIHIFWVFLIVLSAFGIVLYSALARIVFIVLNIIHIIVLGFLVFTKLGNLMEFLDYFFKLYFNLVASGCYVGLITIPTVRKEFEQNWERFAASLSIFKKADVDLRDTSKGAKGFYNLALTYVRLGRKRDAVIALQKAVEISPDNDNYFFKLGLVQYDQKNFHEAISALKETVKVNPIHYEAYYYLGEAYQNVGCTAEALKSFESASHVKADRPELFAKIGKLSLALKKHEDALTAFKKASELDSQDAGNFYFMGSIYRSFVEDLNSAKDFLKRAVRINPKYLEAHFELGLIALKQEKPKEAIREFREVVSLDDKHKQGHYNLGVAYSQIKDFNSARREFQVLEVLDPDLANDLSMFLK